MAWGSFNDNLDRVVTALQTNAGIDDYCRVNFGRGLTVKRTFKHRTEIALSDLPYCMVTRPSMDSERTTGLIYRDNSIRLYIGFHEPDREKAQTHLIELEELVEQAMYALDLASSDMMVTPKGSMNDEGYFHPVYFFVKDVGVFIEREV